MVGWGHEDVVPIIITTQLILAVLHQMDVITVNGKMIDHTAVVRSVQRQLTIKRKEVGIVLHGFFGTVLTNWKQKLVAIPVIFILFVKSSCRAAIVWRGKSQPLVQGHAGIAPLDRRLHRHLQHVMTVVSIHMRRKGQGVAVPVRPTLAPLRRADL